jgi:Na+/phosphate symporter
VIRVTTKDKFTSEQIDALKDFIRNKLVGVEIVSQSRNEVVLQTILNYSELSVQNALRRMSIIATSMHRDAMAVLKENDRELAQTIVKTDDEVDRFSFFIIRQLKLAVGDNRIIKEIGLKTARDCLGYRLITKSVERAADHAVSIARNAMTMKPVDAELLKKISESSDFAISIFEEAINSLFIKDYNSADDVLMRKKSIENYDKTIIGDITSKHFDSETVASLRLIVESIRRLAEYGSDIAEVVLNLAAESLVQ